MTTACWRAPRITNTRDTAFVTRLEQDHQQDPHREGRPAWNGEIAEQTIPTMAAMAQTATSASPVIAAMIRVNTTSL